MEIVINELKTEKEILVKERAKARTQISALTE